MILALNETQESQLFIGAKISDQVSMVAEITERQNSKFETPFEKRFSGTPDLGGFPDILSKTPRGIYFQPQ